MGKELNNKAKVNPNNANVMQKFKDYLVDRMQNYFYYSDPTPPPSNFFDFPQKKSPG
jgi:hypothetical protein